MQLCMLSRLAMCVLCTCTRLTRRALDLLSVSESDQHQRVASNKPQGAAGVGGAPASHRSKASAFLDALRPAWVPPFMT